MALEGIEMIKHKFKLGENVFCFCFSELYQGKISFIMVDDSIIKYGIKLIGNDNILKVEENNIGVTLDDLCDNLKKKKVRKK